jgi:hypothetical protein
MLIAALVQTQYSICSHSVTYVVLLFKMKYISVEEDQCPNHIIMGPLVELSFQSLIQFNDTYLLYQF